MSITAVATIPKTREGIELEITRRWYQHLIHSLAGRKDSARSEMEAIDALLERLPR